MIKRITAVSFILFVNIILLAHAVIPHHHHHGEFCIANQCQNDCDSNKNNIADHNHKSNGNSDNQFCVLKQVVVVPQKILKSTYNFDDDQNHSHLSQFLFFNSGCDLKCYASVTSVYRNDKVFYHSLFLIAGLGLRAPPSA